VRTLTSRLVSSFLYGITIVDVATYVGVIVVVGAVGMAATFVPARRILRIDPTSALRV
jgi:putative ABC transport system permease protein